MDMGVLALEFDQIVRREIDHQDRAARPHHARRLGQRRRWIVGIMQHVMDGHDVEGPSLEGQGVHVALPDIGVLDAASHEVGPGKRQHLTRLIDSDGEFDLGGQHFKEPTCARADIEQLARTGR